MDGVQELVGVTVVAATNRPDVIVRPCSKSRIRDANARFLQDSALMRPGRLDRIVFVGPPDAEGREEIVKIHTRHMSVDPAFNAEEIALLVSVLSHCCIRETNRLPAPRPMVVPGQRLPQCAKKLQC